MNIFRSCVFFAALLFVTVFAVPGFAQAAHCPAFPRVVWWKGLSHQSAIAFVDNNYDGDWQPLIKAWQNNLRKLQDIREKGSIASIRYKSAALGQTPKTRRIKLSGEKLDEYIANVWKRLAVMHCLSDL